jgi:hypothetical protein
MHATRDTNHVINLQLVGGRVMRSVRLLRFYKIMTEARGWQRRAALSQSGVRLSAVCRASGYPSGGVAGGAGSELGWWREARAVSVAHPNKPMHPTADTHHVIDSNGLGRRVIGGVRPLVA